MNPELSPEFDEVLLTAYLDDEVTDGERALVQEQLRTSESSRKLLEELRSVRNLVVQLHLSQPSRSFQRGPWSDTKETFAESKVILSKVVVKDDLYGLSVQFQRLASLAALIAIAVCVSVLMWGPNRVSMSFKKNPEAIVELASPPATAGMLAESNAPTPATPLSNRAQAPELPPQFVPSDFSFFESLLQEQADGKSEWLALDGRSEKASLGVRSESSAELSEKDSEAKSENSQLRARYSFIFRGTETDQYKKSSDGIAKTEKQTLSRDPIELNLESSVMEKEEELNSMVVELQVPVEEWTRGAKRLRQMGIEVPIELPVAQYLDFTATRAPKNTSGLADYSTNNSPVDRWNRGATTLNASPAIGWVFRSVELSRNPAETRSATDKTIVRDTDELERNEEPDKIRIRVRVIKKE